MQRVIMYIDGMNLYHGLRAKYGHRYLWLDLEALARAHLRPRQRLTAVRYFTALVRTQPASKQRQDTYLSALTALCPRLEIVLGRFQERVAVCRTCGARRITHDEKETDVNIATSLVTDAVVGSLDVAMIISADADLTPAVRAARAMAPRMRFVAAFPPNRRSDALRRACDASFTLGDARIRAAQLPERVSLPNGHTVARPTYWHGGQ